MKKIIWNTSVTLVILLMTVAVIIYVAPHLNWRVDAVISGSMGPDIRKGSLVVTRPVSPGDVRVGDVITFSPISVGENLITHRVVGIQQGPYSGFVTKGDANVKTDPFVVPSRNLIGKVVFDAPYLGSFTQFLKTDQGFLTTVVMPGVIVIIAYVIAILKEIREYLRSIKKTVTNEY